MNPKYKDLLASLITVIVIGLAYSTKSERASLAVCIFLLGILLVYALNWYYNSKVEKIEDERTELISTKSARNAFAIISVALFPSTCGSTPLETPKPPRSS